MEIPDLKERKALKELQDPMVHQEIRDAQELKVSTEREDPQDHKEIKVQPEIMDLMEFKEKSEK